MSGEKEIIDQLRHGHHSALALVMSQYQDYVYSILKSMLYQHEAEEAAQDTFIKVYKHINQYNDHSKFSTWLYSIAYRTGLDYLKKRKAHQPIDEVHFGIGVRDEINNFENDNMKHWIDSEIRKLDPSDATLIKLYYLNEYSIKEVSDITGLSVPNVKVKLFRTRNMLKERMAHLKLSDLIN